ncbi:MAG: trypsin-like peptidase domain-containing protein [Bryobacteraceae bacterium]|nr:trypsin-like peptidase domain-containing protein [Bryobacteraceae bacterium]
MRKRTIILAVILAAGFIGWTSWSKWGGRATLISNNDGPWWTGPSTVEGAGLEPDEQNNIDIYKRAREATVNITSTVLQRNWFLEVFPVKESGSGIIIDKQGRILTNAHVVSGRAPSLEVTLAGGQKYKAERIYVDQANDMALIKINPKGDVRVLPLGDSDRLQVGQKVLAIGNPFGLDGTLTTGIVSALGRDIGDENGQTLERMIQTDAAINPGNSGGPLLDSSGNVIGINTAIYGHANVGIGFALPINRAKEMIVAYQTGHRYGRPSLGVETVFVEGDLAVELSLPEEGGLLIQSVVSGSAAESAGLRGPRRAVAVGNFELGIGGDLIMAMDGQKIDGRDALTRYLNRKKPGDRVKLTVFRNGKKIEVAVTLGEAGSRL